MHRPMPVDSLERRSDHVEEPSRGPWGVLAIVLILLVALTVAVLAYSGPADQPVEPAPEEQPLYPAP